MAQKILFELVAEDTSLGLRIEQARKNIRDLNKEIRANPGPERMGALVAELGKTRRELTELTKQQRQLNKEFEALKVPKDSLAGLRLEYGRLAQAVAKLSAEDRKSQFGQNLIKQARNTKREIDAIEQSIGRFTGNVGNYRSALNSVGQAFAALGITASVGEIVQTNTRISDSIADVAKTAGITIDEAQRLADTLEFRDTRTSLADQLQIAQIGGQLGVAADQLEQFTESVDVLNVSLGDQFGSVEEITRVVAGLRNVLTDFRTGDVSNDILRLGNALNFLEAEGNATAPTIAEFVNRISGAAIPLGVTTDQIFGLSTALAELAINPERGATAVNILLSEIAKAPDVFANSLNIPVDEFNKLVREDLLGALALVSEKVTTGAIDNVEFAKTLDQLGIGRQGAIEVFGKLGGNIDLLNKRVEQSAEVLQSTDSVYAEFDKKNNNAAAAVEKLQNAIVNLIASEGAQDAIESVAKALTGLVTVLGDALELVSENKTEFAALTAALLAFTGPGQRMAAIMLEINAAARVSSLGIAAGTTATIADTVAKRANTVATNILAAAQKAMPLLLLVAGIYAVVKAFEIYNANLSAAEKASKAVSEAQESIARSSADEIVALNASIGVLQDAAASQDARAAAIQRLTDKYPDYLRGIDLEKQNTAQLAVIQRELTAEIIRSAAAREKANAQSAVAAQIVQKELDIARLREKQAAGGFSFQDLDFRIQAETQKLEKLREQLRLTGEEFDKVFKLNEPVQSSVIDIVDPKSLKEDSEELKKGLDLIASDEKKAGEKAAREREKRAEDQRRALEAQEKRIAEIRRSVRDLSLSEEDAFNRKLAELENRRADELEKNAARLQTLRDAIRERTGKEVTGPVQQAQGVTAADITEADLIDQETEAINAAFDRQRDVLRQEREKTAQEQQRALEALRLEVEQITAENIAALAEATGRTFEAAFQQQRDGLQREFAGRNVALLEALKNGQITQAEFDRAQLANQIEQNNRLVALEQQYAAQIAGVAEDVKAAKIQAAKASLDAQLQAIEERRAAEVAELTVQGGSTAAQAVSEVNKKAAQEAVEAQRQFTNTVEQTTAQAEAAQLQAVDNVNAAKEAAHQAELQRIQDEEERRRRLIQAGIDAAGQIAGSIVQIQQNQNRQETEAALEALDEQYAARIEAAKGNAKLQEKLEKELAAKKEAIQKQAAEKEKRLSIIQSIINTAVAVTKVLFNPILAAFVAAAGLAQTAVIAKQQFAEGGFDRKKKKRTGVYPRAVWDALPPVVGGFTGQGGSYTDSTGRRVAGKLPSGAVVHAGEYVAPASQVMQYPELFAGLEQERTRRARPFAAGGFTLPGLPAYIRTSTFQTGGFADPVIGLPSASQVRAQAISVQASATFSDDQVQQIAQIIAQENGRVLQRSIAEGLGDANRRLDREQSLTEQRTI